jgi:hypothetical protein
MLLGSRLIELWKDGVFIFIAPGDEDFLGWRTHGFDKPIHRSNFVGRGQPGRGFTSNGPRKPNRRN